MNTATAVLIIDVKILIYLPLISINFSRGMLLTKEIHFLGMNA